MLIAKTFLSNYDLNKDNGNICFLDQGTAIFVNLNLSLTLAAILEIKVVGHFELTYLDVI